MKLWFVRHKPTGHYIPEPKGRNGRGGSFLEPSSNKDDARIFRSELSAKRFIGAWLKGQYHHSSSVGYDYEGNPDYYEDVSIVPVPSRIREDMKIIMKEIIL